MNFAKYQKGLISSLLDNAQLAELGRILQLNISEFSAKELLELIYKIALDARVNNFDITEIDASIDAPDNRTVRLAALSILRIAAAKAGAVKSFSRTLFRDPCVFSAGVETTGQFNCVLRARRSLSIDLRPIAS